MVSWCEKLASYINFNSIGVGWFFNNVLIQSSYPGLQINPPILNHILLFEHLNDFNDKFFTFQFVQVFLLCLFLPLFGVEVDTDQAETIGMTVFPLKVVSIILLNFGNRI